LKVKPIIGRFERVNFIELDLLDIDAKIDTGAYSSAIHCHDIWEDETSNTLHFKLLDPSHPDYNEKDIQFKNYSKTVVKSSTGIKESRFKINTNIQVGKKIYATNFTLTDRSNMRFPVLLGRVILKRFLVDASKKYLLSSEEK
jgi:hypothetical protein